MQLLGGTKRRIVSGSGEALSIALHRNGETTLGILASSSGHPSTKKEVETLERVQGRATKMTKVYSTSCFLFVKFVVSQVHSGLHVKPSHNFLQAGHLVRS